MNIQQILDTLTVDNKQDAESFDDKLEQILRKTFSLIPEEIKVEMINSWKDKDEKNNVRWQYLHTVLFVLDTLRKTKLENDDEFFSVTQYRTIKAAIEIAVSMGVIPFLLPGIGVDMSKLCPRATNLPREEQTDLQKYEQLSFSVCVLTDCFKETALRPAVLAQLGSLVAALLQLCYAPLTKPSDKSLASSTEEMKSTKFRMSTVLYEKLTRDQEKFRVRFYSLIDECPQFAIIKELMVILGVKDAPNWIRRQTRKCLIDRIMQPNGILSLVLAVCDDILDLGAHWDKLDTIARLVATPQSNDPSRYYDSVCSQLVELVAAKNIKHASTIANCYITTLYETDPDICTERIIRVIAAPLLVNVEKTKASNVIKSESEVSECIENLSKCFPTIEAKFKHLPYNAMAEIAIPLFLLHVKARRSIFVLRNKVQRLLLLLLSDETLQDSLFSVFLEHDNEVCTGYFGEKLTFRFGSNGGFEITGENENLEYEELSDSLYDLVRTDGTLSYNMFTYLLKYLSNVTKFKCNVVQQNLLETSSDVINRIEKRLMAVKLLTQLAETPAVQQAQIDNPEHIISFVKVLFDEKTRQVLEKNENTEKNDTDNVDVLYVSLMLIKVILTERKKPKDWKSFNELAEYLNEASGLIKKQPELLVLVQEVVSLIKTQGTSVKRHYHDLSESREGTSEFEKALKNLADPLLPVRAHGLMTLTKLIENSDTDAIAKKDVILCFFRENLKHEDSFIYLAAVNGLCALATLFPRKIIEMLVQEYIDMPQRNVDGGIAPETRAKLGEILVKVTRTLGDMAPAYKNVLINGFLCGTRDSDSLVRASSLSCLGELCKVLGFRLGNIITEILYCIGCIIKTDKALECRRAGVLVATLLLRGLGKAALTNLGSDLVVLYRGLIHLRNNDNDPVLRLHAQLALEEFDDIVQNFMFSKPKLEKHILLLDPPL